MGLKQEAALDIEIIEEKGDKEEVSSPLATVQEVLSFAETTKTKVYIGLGVFFALVSGSALPASLFYFSSVMGNISAIGEEGLDPVLEIVYVMMVLGVISLISETMQCEYSIM